MIVEPAPAAPRGRRHRVAWVLGIVLPVVLLVSAVTAGLAGPKEVTPEATARAVAQAEASPASTIAEPDFAFAPVVFPTVAADLAVLSIPDAQARIDLVTPGPFAVAGYLTEVGPYPPCGVSGGDTRGDLGPLCVRHARLEGLPDGGDAGPHMDLTIAAGARMPAAFERLGGEGRPIPVVLVGRYGPRLEPCHPTIYECNGSLLVERVTWIGRRAVRARRGLRRRPGGPAGGHGLPEPRLRDDPRHRRIGDHPHGRPRPPLDGRGDRPGRRARAHHRPGGPGASSGTSAASRRATT